MKSKQLLLILNAFFFLSLCHSQAWMDFIPDEKKADPAFYDVQQAFYEYARFKEPSSIEGVKQYKRWEWYMQGRVNEEGLFPADLYWREYQKVKGSTRDGLMKNVNWTPVGPFNVPGLINYGFHVGVGRVDCIAFHPFDEDVLWVGTPGGGAWKSINGGLSWSCKTDQLPTLGVSDIIVHPINPDIVYLATGERDSWNTFSVGVLKSTDGGETWEVTGLSYEVQDLKAVNQLLMHPDDPDILIAATSQGIFKTTDGGANWLQVVTSGHFMDMVFKPGDPTVVYASTYHFFGGARIFKSTDGGDSFDYLYGTGMPAANTCRIKLATSPADPDLIYAFNCKTGNYCLEGFYRSLDNGITWEKTISGDEQDLVGYVTSGPADYGQGFYNLSMVVSNDDPDEILVGGTHIWKSTDGGETFILNDNCYIINDHWIHADIHEFDYHPLNDRLYAGCDGGIYMSDDHGANWNDISEGLQITQSYRLGVSELDADLMVIGNQDNGSFKFDDNDCVSINSADGMDCFIGSGDPEILYTSYQYGVLFKSTNGGISQINITPDNAGNAVWTAPFLEHPTNPDIIYAGYTDIFKSSDKGSTWDQITFGFTNGALIHRLLIAPGDDQVMYAASYNTIWRTTDGGVSWNTISNDLPPFQYPSIPFDVFTFYDLEVSAIDPDVVWVTYSNFMDGIKVFKSMDGGDNWLNISGNLPNFPVNCIVYQPGTNDGIYVGLDVGVYYTDNNLNTWFDVSNGLPGVVITDLEIVNSAHKLVAATYGRGVWETDLFDPVTSVENPISDGIFTVWPNPASEQISIQYSCQGESRVTITLMDLTGHILLSKKSVNAGGVIKDELDISGIAGGTYVLSLSVDNRPEMFEKIIKL
ncbi:MAG: T9SS type A sorting domain-containing protein [Bacteroidetes bacterium]|nr:T9SS type A sorting domain-containing protein [Bacteroidota bacterium]